mgnify:CR=1 FL=1
MMEIEASVCTSVARSNGKDEGAGDHSASSSSGCFDQLSTESLAHIASFCDFPSALRFANSTNRSLRRALYEGEEALFLWRQIFERHYYSLPQPSIASINSVEASLPLSLDFIRETTQRRHLTHNLLLPQSKGRPPARSCCFNLPNRYFFFVPITPDGHFHQLDDPPPVDFGCDSFILTSSACGGELLLLDPFHGSLAVYESCLQNSVASDERMIINAMLKAADIIGGSKNLEWDEDMEEESIAGEIFADTVYKNHNIDQYKKPPFQTLFQMEDYIDATTYFPDVDNDDDDDIDGVDIERGFHGIDSKTIVKEGKVVGTMVAAGRMFTKEGIGAQGELQEVVCTELITWSRMNVIVEKIHSPNRRNHPYGDRMVCRFPRCFKTIDFCAARNRVVVTFQEPDRTSRTRNQTTSDNATIYVYSMLPCSKHIQEPETSFKAQANVVALTIDPTGDMLLVATEKGTCEVWKISSDRNGTTCVKRSSILSIKRAISKAIQSSDSLETDAAAAAASETESVSRMRRALPALFDRPAIASYHYPSHLPLTSCGFVTLQHSLSDGSSLLLWQKNDDPLSREDFKVVSMINLPLSSIARAPRIFFDGRRIIVYGSDHIGMIILVYQVLSSNEDIRHFQPTRMMEETSGGVYNFSSPPKARFANRIRHAALGGLKYYDSIHMTCNERFIIVNTKTGNCLTDSACPYSEGLLVIDLDD